MSLKKWMRTACWLVLAAVALTGTIAHAAKQKTYPLAVLKFQERGEESASLGIKVSDLLFAQLVVDPSLYLVDRQDLDRIMEELELNISGAVNPNEANRLGQLTGARLIVTGSVISIDKSIYLVAKIIGTETSRVAGASVKGTIDDPLDALCEKLATEVIKTVTKQGSSLVAPDVGAEDRLAALRKRIPKGKRPKLIIDIEESHAGQPTPDPAAETEVMRFAQGLGFPLIDASRSLTADADILLIGEAISEFAVRRGNLVTVKARVEVKAVDRETGSVLAVDRQVRVEVDLTEQIAAKQAIQEAAATISERMLPRLVNAAAANKANQRKQSDRKKDNEKAKPDDKQPRKKDKK